MAAPVWLLSVDLQTKTATFQTGLADAAKAARGSFQDIKAGAGEMGRETNYSMMEARHSVMMLGEEFGVHLPRSLTSFIASIGPLGAVLEAAFPFLAIALGATLLIEKLVKMHEAGEKLSGDQLAFGTAANNAFNQLDDKLLQAQIRADELNKNHLGALHHQLELIDHQSMTELVHTFSELAKAADVVMKDIEGHWYTFGEGSDGAKHALEDFQRQYENLRSKGDEQGMTGLLHGTLDQARKTLEMMDQLKASRSGDGQKGNYDQYEKAAEYLNKMGVLSKITGENTKNTYAAQQNLVEALEAQVGAEQRIKDIKSLETNNAVKTEHLEENKDAGKHADEVLRYNAAVNRMMAEDDKQSVDGLRERERQRVDATVSGGQERLDAINAAMQEEEAYGRAGTAFYKQLAAERTELIKHMADEQAKLSAEAAREDADNQLKMGELSLAAIQQTFRLLESARRANIDRQIEDEEKAAQDEYSLKLHALMDESAALDATGKDYQNKLKQLQDKEKQLIQQHENDITSIKEKAEIERNQRVLSSFTQFEDSIARGLTQSIMGHQTWAKMVQGLGDQVVSGMIQNAIKSMMTADLDKEKQAAKAARQAYNIGLSIGGPAGIVLGPLFGAAAFAAQMAFAEGTDRVPGVGRGDVVPSMLTPGEGVVPGGVMDGLRNVARNGGFDHGPSIHATAHFAPQIHAIDATGVDKMLTKHADKFQRHFENTLRKMNR